MEERETSFLMNQKKSKYFVDNIDSLLLKVYDTPMKFYNRFIEMIEPTIDWFVKFTEDVKVMW